MTTANHRMRIRSAFLLLSLGAFSAFSLLHAQGTPDRDPVIDPAPTVAPPAEAPRPPEDDTPEKLPRRKTFDRTVERSAVVIEAEGDVTNMMAAMIDRKLADARKRKVDVVIVRIDTYGGLVAAAELIVDTFRNETELYIVAYVDTKAISAGTMMALACDEIVIHRSGRIGDCMPITVDPQSGAAKRSGTKIESYLQTQFRQMAEDNGYDPLLAESFVNPDIEVLQIEEADTDKRTYRRRKELQATKQIDMVKVVRIVVPEGTLLTMTASEAKDLGFTEKIVETDRELFDYLNIRGEVPTLKATPTEVVLLWISPYAPLLFTVGLIALFIAIRTPGTGAPELAAALCFIAFFTIQALVGHQATIGLLLFLAGVALLCVEIFIIPGFGVVGIMGLACIGLGLVVSLLPSGFDWRYPADMDFLWSAVRRGLLALLVAMLLAMLLTLILPKTPFARPFILEQSIEGIHVVDRADDLLEERRGSTVLKDHQMKPLEGKTGVTLSDLRPSGVARIDGQRMDVVSSGEFIAKGAAVVVSKVESMRVFVREAPKG